MRKLPLALIALALGLAPLAAPARAQVIVPQAQGDMAIDNMRRATEGAERATAILVKVAGNPAYANARNAAELGAGLAAMRDEIATARRDVRAIATELAGLPRVAGPSSPDELQLIDRVVADIGLFATKIDDLFATMEELGDALEAGNDARSQQLAASLMKGSVAIVEGQALMLRARLPMMPSDSSSFAQVSSLACFYEGFAGLQNGAYGLIKRPEAAALMAHAHRCMTDHVAAGRAAIEREAATDLNEPTLNALRDGLVPVHREMFTELAGAADLLERARTALARGDSMDALMIFGEQTTRFEGRFQALVSREVEVVRRQGR